MALIELFRRNGLAGATVLKGVAGLPRIDGMMGGGLITMEKVRVIRYDQTRP